MHERVFIGIDPGFSGAFACYRPEQSALIIEDMPLMTDPKSGRTLLNYRGVFTLLQPNPDLPVTMAMLEQVAARPGQGAPATFRFGQGYGALEMALAGHLIPTTYITPAKWKKHFGLSKDKGASRTLASQLFPQYADLFTLVKHDGRAEAALLALYAHQTHVQ